MSIEKYDGFTKNNLYQDMLKFLHDYKPKHGNKLDIADFRQQLKHVVMKHTGPCGGGCELADKYFNIKLKK